MCSLDEEKDLAGPARVKAWKELQLGQTADIDRNLKVFALS